MGRVLDDQKKVDVEMDMTPMIDVTFLLLVFFVMTFKFKTSEGLIQSYLPRDRGTSTSKAKIPTETRLRILWYALDSNAETLDEHGRAVIRIDREEIATRVYSDLDAKCRIDGCGQYHGSPDMDALFAFLLKRKASYVPPPGRDPAKGLPVTIDGRPRVPFKFIVQVLNECVKAGISDVTFAAAEKPF
jgi:biopolymer transport protein ExbD